MDIDFDLNENLGEKEQEPAETAQTGMPEQAENTTVEQPPLEPENQQSARENARYAGIRRRAEAEAKQRAEKQVEEKLRKMGIVDPETARPVKNRDEYEKLRQQRYAQDRDSFMKNNDMDVTQYYNFVGSLPEVRAARIAQERAVNAEVQTKMNEELRQISELDPEIREVEDIKKSPSYDRVLELVKRGNNLLDAYKLANFDSITKSAVEAQRQAAYNSFAGKSHMRPLNARQGTGMQPVPRQVMDQYRLFNPKATDTEIAQHYNKELRKGG